MTLTSEHRNAIQESVDHWQRMRDDIYCGEYPEADDCALCREIGSCEFCPVFRKTGCHDCVGTPFIQASIWFERVRKSRNAISRWYARRHWRKAAQAEIDFLESLLEEK